MLRQANLKVLIFFQVELTKLVILLLNHLRAALRCCVSMGFMPHCDKEETPECGHRQATRWCSTSVLGWSLVNL